MQRYSHTAINATIDSVSHEDGVFEVSYTSEDGVSHTHSTKVAERISDLVREELVAGNTGVVVIAVSKNKSSVQYLFNITKFK